MTSTATRTDYADINGLRLYYEVRGAGRPLVLLHGGAGNTENFDAILPTLGEGRQVVLADLEGHGRTADIGRPFSYETMGDDIAGLIGHLGIAQADVMGYSLGGGVALRTAIQHPELVRKLVLVSAPFKRTGWYPEVLSGMQMGKENAEAMKQTPMYETYARVAPHVEDWPLLMTRLADMLVQDYDWSNEVGAMTTPTMVALGDADSIRTAHGVEFFELLGGGKGDAGWDGSGMTRHRLAILPGTTHYNIFASPLLASAVRTFLDE